MKARLVLWSVLTLLLARSVSAQCPGFPARGVTIIDALYIPTLANGADDDRRQLTRSFIEQLAYEFPTEGWTWKSADPGRPPSKDSISRLVNGRLCNWDWQNGSTRQRAVQVGQPGDDITGQNPIAVPGVNHLVSAPPPVVTSLPPPPYLPPPPPSIDMSSVYAALQQQFQQQYMVVDQGYKDLSKQIVAVSNQVANVDVHLTHMDNEPGWFHKVYDLVADPRVLSAIGGGFGGWMIQRRLAKPNAPAEVAK